MSGAQSLAQANAAVFSMCVFVLMLDASERKDTPADIFYSP